MFNDLCIICGINANIASLKHLDDIVSSPDDFDISMSLIRSKTVPSFNSTSSMTSLMSFQQQFHSSL